MFYREIPDYRVRHMYENDKIYVRFVKFLLFYTIYIHKNDWKKKKKQISKYFCFIMFWRIQRIM